MSSELSSAIQEVADEIKFSRWMERAFVVANNAGIRTEDESQAIAEQLKVVYQITEGDTLRQRFLKTTAEQFFNYFASLGHKVPSVAIAEIVGDLYTKEGGLSAIHFYCFSFVWAEQCNKPEEYLLRLLSKLDILEKKYYFRLLHNQYVASELKDGCFDDQLYSLRSSPDKFSKMIHHFVDASSTAYSETTKDLIENMAYCLISRISNETWRIPGELKAELTNKLLSLRTPPRFTGPVYYETHQIARRRRSVQDLRRSIIDARQVSCDEEMSIQLWFRGIKDILIDMIDEVVSILGEPRSGIDFAVIAMGSFGRGESSAFSDLEMAIVYKKSGLAVEVVQEYLRVFSTLLWLRIVMLMEDNSKIPHMRCGIKLDSSFSFSPEGSRPLIMEVSEMVKEFKDGELILSNQLARTRFIWGQEAIALELQSQIQVTVRATPALSSKMLVDTLDELLRQYTVLYDRSVGFNVKEEIRLVTLFVQVAGLHFGIFEASTVACLRKLVQEQKMHKGFAQALKTALVWLLSLRYDMHIFYGRECDDFVMSRQHLNPAETEKYVLTPAQRRKWFLFSPMITNIVVHLIEEILKAKDFLTYVSKLPDQTLHHLANYFVLQHEDELLRYREKEGLSIHSTIDNSCWKDPIILRANYYFEMGVLCSVDGTQSAFNNLVGKFFKQTGPLCSIREEYQEQYLTAQPEVYGRRRVIPLSSEVHLKAFPELPGQECLASEIAHRITGYTTSFSCLRKYANRKPLLISKTVIGINLQTFLKNHANALESIIDDESFSWQFIRTLLLNPEDDKPDNFMVMAFYDEWEHQERIKLVCVDNDHTLSEPVVKGLVWNELLVKSIIFCSKSMEKRLHPRVIEFFTSSNLEELVISICEALINVDDEHCGSFTRAEWSQESHDDLNQKIECKIPMFVSEEAAVRLFVKLKTLKSLMENDPQITHGAIMTHASLEPIVGKVYEKARTNSADTTEERFSKVTSGLYKIVGNTRMTVSNSEKMLRSSLGKAPTKEQIEQRLLYTPRQMKTKFFSILPQQLTSQVAKVRRALIAMDPQAKQMYYDLGDNILREEVISGRQLTSGESEPGINFENLNVTQQQFIIQLLKKNIPSGSFFANGKLHSFSRLVLRHCTALTDRDLLKILSQSPFLQVLDVRDCGQLTDTALTNIPQVCPRLRVFLKDPRSDFSSMLSVILSAVRLMRDDDDEEVDIDTSINLLENALSNEGDDFAKHMGYLALQKMNVGPDYLKSQPSDRVATLFTCVVRMSIVKSEVTKELLMRATKFFLSICISSDSELKLSKEIIVEFARLMVMHLADEEVRRELTPVDVLLLLIVDTKLICLIAADAGKCELVDGLISTFEVVKLQHAEVDDSALLISYWLGIIVDSSAEHLPQSIVDFSLNIWYNHAKKSNLWRTHDSKLIILLPKLLYSYNVSSSILLFLLESLGELYVHAESDIEIGGDLFQNIIIHLFIKFLGGLLIESQLQEVSHKALYDFVQRAKEHREIILASQKATLCMAFHAAFIAKTLRRPDTYGFLLFMVAKALSLPIFPKSKRSNLSNTLKTYLNSESHWMNDEELRDVCRACVSLRRKQIDVVAVSLCLWLRRSSIRPTPEQLCQILTMLAEWRRTGLRLLTELYTLQVAAHVLAFYPSPLPDSILSALEKLLLPLREQVNEDDDANDANDNDEAAGTTAEETNPQVLVTAEVNVAADAYTIVDAQVNAIVLGPAEFPAADPTGAAAAEEVVAEVIDQWTVMATEAEVEDGTDEEVFKDTPRNAAVVKMIHHYFRPQISMLLQQRCPQYSGLLLHPEDENEANPSHLNAEEVGDSMIQELVALVAAARNPEDSIEEISTSKGEDENRTEFTGQEKFNMLFQYLGHGFVIEGFTSAQMTRLLSAITSIMMDPEHYSAECCDVATRCCIDMVDRDQFPSDCLSLVIFATITATSRQTSGEQRQTLCWLLDQLIERYQTVMTREEIDTLIEFFVSRLYTAPSAAMAETAAGTADTTMASPPAAGAETYPSARQNSFVGLIKLVEVSQSNNCPLTKAQWKRIRDILVECLRWDTVTFENMSQIERDEVRVLLSGEILTTLNHLIAGVVGSP